MHAKVSYEMMTRIIYSMYHKRFSSTCATDQAPSIWCVLFEIVVVCDCVSYFTGENNKENWHQNCKLRLASQYLYVRHTSYHKPDFFVCVCVCVRTGF